MRLRQRVNQLEKAIQPDRAKIEIHKFTESDLKEYLSVCKGFNDRWPAAIEFKNPDSEDVEEMAKVWCDNMVKILALAVIRAGLDEPDNSIKEFLHGEGIEL